MLYTDPPPQLDAVNENVPRIPLVVILGPTAVGKSDMAIELAEEFGGEIVSADSRLFYRGMDIGTAKPTAQDRQRVRHHLIDLSNPDQVWSLGVFQHEADKAIRDIYSRQHLPLLVGGTGQFMRAIIEGWSMPAVEPDPSLRKALSAWMDEIGALGLHAKLASLDPLAAKAIDASNSRRTIRALEVIFTTGKRFSDQSKRGHVQYNNLLLGLTYPRAVLYQRIDERIDKMIENGFIEEVRRLLDQGYSPGLPTLSAIGYGELVAYIQRKIAFDEAIRLMKRRTRIFVRRQANWFKENDPKIHWFQVNSTTRLEMSQLIKDWLRKIQKTDHPT